MRPENARRRELANIKRISDQLCTSHAWLAGHNARWATFIDVGVLLSSAWVASLAFIDPALASSITPGDLKPTFWIGLMGLLAFGLTLIQTRVDLRGRADSHRRALDAYTQVKRGASRLLSEEGEPDEAIFNEVLAKQDFASSLGIAVPERWFLPLKQKHLLKIATSRHLDKHPAANLLLFKLQLAARDSFGKAGRDETRGRDDGAEQARMQGDGKASAPFSS